MMFSPRQVGSPRQIGIIPARPSARRFAAFRSAVRPAAERPADGGSPTAAPRTAFVLAGGAALGAMQAGMLQALFEFGITPDLLVGTSAGALNASFLASRPATVATAGELAGVWRGLRRGDVLPFSPAAFIGSLAGRRGHLVSDRRLRELVVRHLQFARLEQAAIPLHLITFDLLSGQEVRLSEGSAIDAVLATAAIPGVLPAVPWQGRLLVDGGVTNNTPISHAIELGAERIYVLPTVDAEERGLSRPPRSPITVGLHTANVLANARLYEDIGRYAGTAELIVLPAVNPSHIGLGDFGHAGQLIEPALDAARTALAARAAEHASVSGGRDASGRSSGGRDTGGHRGAHELVRSVRAALP